MVDPDLRFFEASAQIIPVLGLVLLVERRLFDRAGDIPGLVYALLVLLVGEIVSLRVLLRGSASHADETLVIVALAASGILIVGPPLLRLLIKFWHERKSRRRAIWVADAIFIAMLIVSFFVVLELT